MSSIPQTPPRSHRKHRRTSSGTYATPKTPFRHDLSLDYKILSKTNLLKTPSSHNSKPFTVYQAPMTPKSASCKKKSDILTPPSSVHHSQLETAPFNGRLLFPLNPSRIGSGRNHHRTLKAPSLTTLLTLAANETEEEEEDDEETSLGFPMTPKKQIMKDQVTLSPPPIKIFEEEDDFEATQTKIRNPFVDQKDEIKKELVYVDKHGNKKVEKLSDEEAHLLQKTKRKLKF